MSLCYSFTLVRGLCGIVVQNKRNLLVWKRATYNAKNLKANILTESGRAIIFRIFEHFTTQSDSGHFRVPPGLCLKQRVGAQPLILKSFFILESKGFLELRSGLAETRSNRSIITTCMIFSCQWISKKIESVAWPPYFNSFFFFHLPNKLGTLIGNYWVEESLIILVSLIIPCHETKCNRRGARSEMPETPWKT